MRCDRCHQEIDDDDSCEICSECADVFCATCAPMFAAAARADIRGITTKYSETGHSEEINIYAGHWYCEQCWESLGDVLRDPDTFIILGHRG